MTREQLQIIPTGTLIKMFVTAPKAYSKDIESELNERFAGFDAQYFNDLRHMAISDYNERKT